MPTIRLIWGNVNGAVSFNIYHGVSQNISKFRTEVLDNTTNLTFDHEDLDIGTTHYYFVAGVGTNGEVGAPSQKAFATITSATITTIYLCPQDFIDPIQPFESEALYSDDTTVDITTLGDWDSSDESVATVSSSGEATILDVGTTDISISYQAHSQSLSLGVAVELNDWVEELTSVDGFLSLQGFDDTHIWAAPGFAFGSTIYFSNGNGTWTPQTLAAPIGCNQIYAASATVVYLAHEDSPNVLQKTTNGGAAWVASDFTFGAHTCTYLSGIHGVGVNNLWAVAGANDGNLYIIKSTNGGGTWTQDYGPLADYANHIWVNSISDIWTADYSGNYYHWNGTSWSTGVIDANQGFDGMWGTSSTNMYFGGFSISADPSKVYHWNGTSFTSQSTTPVLDSSNDWWVISGNPSSTDLWAADFNYDTNDAQIWHSTDGTTWSDSDTPTTHTDEQFIATWRGTNKVYIGSQSGTILAKSLSGGSLIISPPLIMTIDISPSPTTTVGETSTRQFTATANYTDGSSADITTDVTWNSSDTNAATIDAYGVATGVTEGETTNIYISDVVNFACHYPDSVSMLITAAPTLVSIAVTQSTLLTPTTQQYIATGTYSDSSTANLTGSVTWSSTAMSVATIAPTGIATYIAGGNTTLQATLGLVVGSYLLKLANVYWQQAFTGSNFLWGISGTSDGTNIYTEFDTDPIKALHSSDSGVNWTQENGPSLPNTFIQNSQGRVYVASNTSIYISGIKDGSHTSNIIRSTGGGTWTGSNILTDGGITDIHGTGPTNIYAVGFSGLYSSTNDGGLWTSHGGGAQFVVFVTGVNDVWFGGNGGLYHWNGTTISANYWSNFTLVTSGGHLSRQGIWAADANNVWVSIYTSSFDKGYVYRTINGGSSWTVVPFTTSTVEFPGFSRHPIVGITADNIYIGVFGSGTYYYYEGDWIRTFSNSFAPQPFDLWARNANDVYMTGNSEIFHHPGIASQPVPVTINVYPGNKTYVNGTVKQYLAFAVDASDKIYDVTSIVTWVSTSPTKATVSSTGLVTTLVAGSTNIQATLGVITGTTVLTVT